MICIKKVCTEKLFNLNSKFGLCLIVHFQTVLTTFCILSTITAFESSKP